MITKDYTRQSQQAQQQVPMQQSYHSNSVLDLTRPPSAPQAPPASQEPSQGPRYTPEGAGGDRARDRYCPDFILYMAPLCIFLRVSHDKYYV